MNQEFYYITQVVLVIIGLLLGWFHVHNRKTFDEKNINYDRLMSVRSDLVKTIEACNEQVALILSKSIKNDCELKLARIKMNSQLEFLQNYIESVGNITEVDKSLSDAYVSFYSFISNSRVLSKLKASDILNSANDKTVLEAEGKYFPLFSNFRKSSLLIALN